MIYDAPLAGDIEDGKCDEVGFVTKEMLAEQTPIAEADYYFCGPKPFMASIISMLNELGVDPSRQRCEFFGPKQSMVMASS